MRPKNVTTWKILARPSRMSGARKNSRKSLSSLAMRGWGGGTIQATRAGSIQSGCGAREPPVTR